MRKIKGKKLIQHALIFGLFATIFIPSSTFAWPSTGGFAFNIQPNQGNTRSEGAYRSANTTAIPWGVQVDSSNESGDKTYTRFWIEGVDGTNVSESANVLEDSGDKWVNPYSTANQRTVYLTAENNNYNSESFLVTGFWDEEK
ncbi:DUF2712 domain-containing protein [Peribacillus simplex]|uniref:DUF2712 domain-containing protein n=1 Tax=Peribacillus simplex TaxID=1478 RepID=UPI003CEFCE27